MVTTRSRSRGNSPPDASPPVRKKEGKKALGSWFIWNGTWMGTSWKVSQASLLHRRERDAKNACFDLSALALFVATAHYSFDPIEPKNVPALTAVRAACLVVNAMVALIMRMFCNNVMPPVDKKTSPVIYGILSPVGGAAFLTYQSTTFFSLYAIVTAVAEISYARSPSTLAGRVLSLVYYTSPYFQGLAVVLTLLWLKFNWFEKEWQETVIKFWEDLGFRSVAPVQWIGHGTLPLAFVDALLCKDRAIMTTLVQPKTSLVLMVTVHSVLYMAMTLYLKTINGGHYPYPFLVKICEKWTSIVIFTAVITSGSASISLLMRMVSTFEA